MTAKKTILLDFDGTINSYRSGWREPSWDLPDPPLPGAVAFVRRLVASGYDVVIFTTRALNRASEDDDPLVCNAIRAWLVQHGLEMGVAAGIRVTSKKLPCKLIIDDNAYRFEGRYPDPEEVRRLTS